MKHPLEQLSFVKKKGKGWNFFYWNVKSTGDPDKDFELGKQYAAEALEFIENEGYDFLFAHMVKEMIRTGATQTEKTIDGFFNYIAEAAVPVLKARREQAAENMRICLELESTGNKMIPLPGGSATGSNGQTKTEIVYRHQRLDDLVALQNKIKELKQPARAGKKPILALVNVSPPEDRRL